MVDDSEEDLARLGSYLPRAFTITLSHPAIGKQPLTGPLAIPRAAFPTFMHEFAHLIQDWATFRGIMEFINLWDQVAAVADHARRSGAEVLFPLVRSSKEHRLTPETLYGLELDKLRAMTEPRIDWTKDARSWKFIDYKVGRFGLPLSGRTVETRFIRVHLVEEQTGEKYEHRLGAWEIKEAYSVAVALLHGGSPKMPGKAGFEYMVVERILSHYFDGVTPLQTIALCHWALQDLAPADCLFGLIEKLKRPDRKLPPACDLYEVGRADALPRGFKKNCREIVQSLLDFEAAHRAHGNEYVARLFRWHHDHAGRLLLLHLDRKRQFPLDTFLCAESIGLAEAQCMAQLDLLFQEAHLPLLFWADGSAHVINPDPHTQEMAFFNRCVVDLFGKVWRGQKPTWECPVYRSCELAIKDNDDCRNRPWKKAWLSPTCPYGAAAKILGVELGKEFKLAPIVPL